MSRLKQLARRLARTHPGELWELFTSVRRIDFILFEADLASVEASSAEPDAPAVVRITPMEPSGVDEVDARVADSRHCYAVFIDGELAHESWLFFDAVLPMQFGFDPSVPVIGECATPEAFRGRRLYPTTLRVVVRDIVERGMSDRAYLWVAPENIPSIRGVERAGFRALARIRGLKYGGVLFRRRVDPVEAEAKG